MLSKLNPYDPPQTLNDESTDVVKSEGNLRVFAAGVAMVVGGAGVILFRYLGRSFVETESPSAFEFDWLYLVVGLGIVLMLFRGVKSRKRTLSSTRIGQPKD